MAAGAHVAPRNLGSGWRRRDAIATSPSGVFTHRTPRAGSELVNVLLEYSERIAGTPIP
ncbi:hypothetical protein J2W42_004679 [Rhizobium tibeticum]|nr:hypothetical protein [Rhizobium tibeticum]